MASYTHLIMLPRRGGGSFLSSDEMSCRRPLRGLGIVGMRVSWGWQKAPAPGYMPLPLRDMKSGLAAHPQTRSRAMRDSIHSACLRDMANRSQKHAVPAQCLGGPKGRDPSAQGNALGAEQTGISCGLKGRAIPLRDRISRPVGASGVVGRDNPARWAGLRDYRPSALNIP